MLTARTLAITGFCLLLSLSAWAQERPFLFSVSAPPVSSGQTLIAIETSAGSHAFDAVDAEQLQQRIGLQMRIASRLTLLARVGFAPDSRDTRSSQEAELLYGFFEDAAHAGSIAAGGGLRHEPGGTNVLIGRVAAGRRLTAWRVDGNALFEKPFSSDRDAVDLITSVGFARQIFSSLHAGIEAIGEDLEGFWDPNEAEGGAKILVGPSVRVAPQGKRWQVSAAGGPLFRATESPNVTEEGAVRALPVSQTKNSYAIRLSFDYRF